MSELEPEATEQVTTGAEAIDRKYQSSISTSPDSPLLTRVTDFPLLCEPLSANLPTEKVPPTDNTGQ